MKKIIIAVIAIVAIVWIYKASINQPVEVAVPDTTTNTTANKPSTPAKPTTGSTATSSSVNVPPNPVAIGIKDYKYTSATYTIKKGTMVTWTNQDGVAHTVTSDNGAKPLNSPLLSTGQSYSYIFDTVGTYDYHCTPHPAMKAKIIVTN